MAGPVLRDFDVEAFLQQDWQQRPRLLRGALSADQFPLLPEELAGLACEDEVESRLITGNREQGFSLSHGPFEEAQFLALPERDWTLLVQAVDHLLPEVAALMEYFRFIPNWRIDDIMVSYAAQGGSAGPHYDHYDVFLVQGRGSRRWQVGERIEHDVEVVPVSELHLLREFNASHEWELHAGDILYLPPRYAHWGVSTSADCMTYSVGFRAPSCAELLSEFSDQAILKLSDFERYTDAQPRPLSNPGEISADVIAAIRQMVLAPLSDPTRLARWFGQYMTLPRYAMDTESCSKQDAVAELQQALADGATLLRDSASRYAFTTAGCDCFLFVNGTEYCLSIEDHAFVEALCNQPAWPSQQVLPWLASPAQCEVTLALYAQGSLYFADADYDT